MKFWRTLIAAVVVLVTALGANLPQAASAMPGVDQPDMTSMAMSDMPEMADNSMVDCKLCGPMKAMYGCGTACVGLQFVLPAVALAAVAFVLEAHVAVANERMSGVSPPPDFHPPRPLILA